MKRFPPILAAAFLGACASHPPLPKGPQATSLLAGDLPDYRASISKRTEHDGLLKAFPPLIAFGNPGPLGFSRSVPDTDPVLDPLDSADRAPWWWDVLRVETSALVLAFDQSLKDYREGACVDAYARAAGEMGSFLGADPTASEAKALPLSAAAAKRRPSSATELAAWAPWTKLPPELASPGLLKAFGKLLPAEATLTEARRIDSGDGLARYLGLLGDGRLVEFRELELSPLKSEGETWKSGCDRYLKAARIYRPETESKCLFTGGKSYASEFWTPTRALPSTEDFTDSKALSAHVGWICRRLATAHARQMPVALLREIHLSLREGKPLAARLKDYARREAARVLDVWRASLNKK